MRGDKKRRTAQRLADLNNVPVKCEFYIDVPGYTQNGRRRWDNENYKECYTAYPISWDNSRRLRFSFSVHRWFFYDALVNVKEKGWRII